MGRVSIWVFLGFFVGFFVGGVFQKEGDRIKELIIFANLIGEESVEVNKAYSVLTDEEREEGRRVYNELFIKSIGCSAWREDIIGVSNKHLEPFYLGVEAALNKYDIHKSKDPCMEQFSIWYKQK